MMNLGYVDQRGSHYSLTAAMRRSFPIELFPEMVPFFRAVNEKLNDATEAVRTDPPGGIMGWNMVSSGKVGRSYQAAMRWLGSSMIKEVVSRTRIPAPPRRMLDVGGSHGLYCVEFCRKHPALKATVLDWPIGLENARLTLAQERDVAERIDLLEGGNATPCFETNRPHQGQGATKWRACERALRVGPPPTTRPPPADCRDLQPRHGPPVRPSSGAGAANRWQPHPACVPVPSL
jgi:hypothetical protein